MRADLFRNLRAGCIIFLDIAALIGVFSLLFLIRLDTLPDYTAIDLWLIILTFIATLFTSGTYFRKKGTVLPSLPVRTFFVCCVAGMICIFWLYLLGPNQFKEYFGRGILPTGTIIFGVLATLNRLILNQMYFRHESEQKLLYLGFSEFGKVFLRELENHSEVRSLSIYTSKNIDTTFTKASFLKPENSSNPLQERDWSGIIIDPSHGSDSKETSNLVKLRLEGKPIYTLAEYFERRWYMVPIEHIGDDWFLRSEGFAMLGNPVTVRIKRLIDITLSIALGILSIPIILLCSIIIKLSSQGPIFFTQTRVGLQGSPFTICKLRTMIHNAEQGGAVWAKKNDTRVTAFGNFLRRSRLDELPQCWNVFKGEMSFVGPRPERPEFTSELSKTIPYYDLRHMVKPGITGWAQVIFPYGASVEDAVKKLQYELYYIKNQSLLLDLNIMLRTIITIFQRAGR